MNKINIEFAAPALSDLPRRFAPFISLAGLARLVVLYEVLCYD